MDNIKSNQPSEGKWSSTSVEFSKDIDSLMSNVNNTDPNWILKVLLSTLKAVDMRAEVFPQCIEIVKRIDQIKASIQKGEPSGDTASYKEQLTSLFSDLDKYKLSKVQQKGLVIKILLRHIKKLGYDLRIRDREILLFNGQYYQCMEVGDFTRFLGDLAQQCGLDEYESQDSSRKQGFLEQFYSAAPNGLPRPAQKVVLVCFKNGTLEVNDGKWEFREFRKEDGLTNQLPFCFDQNATAPQFEKYILTVLPDEEQRNILFEYLGYLFIRNSTLKAEKALFLIGDGANGKSTLYEILLGLLGKEQVASYSLDKLTQSEGYYRYTLRNKTLNFSPEMGHVRNFSTLKSIISNEMIDARAPYGLPINIVDYARLIFAGNEMPDFSASFGEALRRRLLIIHFSVTIPVEARDPQLAQKIIDTELPGVFAKILVGMERLMKQKRFSESEAVSEAAIEHTIGDDTLGNFLKMYNCIPDKYNKVPQSSLYAAYSEYCLFCEGPVMAENQFGKALSRKGFNRQKLNTGRVVHASHNPFTSS